LLINIILNEICVEFQEKRSFTDGLYNDTMCIDIKRRRPMEMPNLRVLVSKIREQVINKLSLSLSLCVCVCVETYVSDFLTNYCYLLLLFHLLTMYSLKNLWQLICFGGKVLHELWKIKGTSERQITRYTIGK